MWQRGEITVMNNLGSFVPRTLVQQYARSEVRVQRRASALLWWALEQWWGCAECCVVRSGYAVAVGQWHQQQKLRQVYVLLL